MVKATLRNTLDVEVKVTEGNAGVQSERAKLPAVNGTYDLIVDPNATYREYILLILPDDTKVDPSFSSDDVAEYGEIIIKKKDGIVVWEGIPRIGPATENPVIKRLKNIFRWR